MRGLIRLLAALAPIAIVAAGMISSEARVRAAQQPAAEPESHYGPSFEYLAWQLFLEVMTPSDGSPTFEGWTEQCQLSAGVAGCPEPARGSPAAGTGASGRVRLLHGGAGAPPSRAAVGGDCSAMITTPLGGYPAPTNLAANAVYCEEIYIDPVEASFIRRNLATLAAQQIYGSTRNHTINFPGTEQNESRIDLDAVEVKVDWVPAASYRSPGFACPDPTHRLYTETINGTCYALAAVHITSKVMPNWLWATFEPDSSITNPNRCDPRLYGACFDPWGTTSSGPYGKGQRAQQSPELREAMARAHLDPALSNYFLTGVQTRFVDGYGRPVQLGNSFIEFNQGVLPGRSSCITCHQYAAFDGRRPAHGMPQNDYGRPPDGWPSIGYACNRSQNEGCTPAQPGSTTQDFSWVLGLMP